MSVTVDTLKTLHVVVLITIYSLLYSEASDVQEVIFTKRDNSNVTIDSGRCIDVLKNKSLDIIFEMFNAQDISCSDSGRTDHSFYVKPDGKNIMFLNYNNGTSRLQIPVVTTSMSTKWKCKMQNESNDFIYYLFVLRVKGARRVRVEVSGTELEFTDTDLSVSGYDGVYKYEYDEGDFIDLTCTNINVRGELGLRYCDANGTEVFARPQDSSIKQLRFQQSTHVKNNNSYIDCIYLKPIDEYQQEFTYRTILIFKENPTSNDGFIVTINGTKLIKSDINGTDLYRYMYIKGTILDVTCKRKDKQKQGIIDVHTFKHDKNTTQNYYIENIKMQDVTPHQTGERRFLIDTKDLNGTFVRCSSLDNHVANIKFFEDPYRELVVLGLRESDVLYRYSNTTERWVTHYQYTVNESLSLTCMTTGNRTPHWSEESIKPNVQEMFQNNETSYLKGTFLLNYGQDSTSIICNSRKLTTIAQEITIFLHQISNRIKYFSSEESPQDIYGGGSISGTGKGGETPILIIVGYVIAALGIIIGVVWACRWWTKKRKTATEENSYQNIHGDVNPIPAFPTQWNDNEYTYIDNVNVCGKNEENIMVDNTTYCRATEPSYAIPYKRTTTCSNQTENHYTEIGDNFINKMKSKYSVPYEKPIESLPSTSTETNGNSQKENRNKDLQREDRGGSYSNLLMGDSNKAFVNIESKIDNASYVNFKNEP